MVYREASEAKRGRRHDRTARQQEYHGLRDYRPGDSPRWIHWRTTARVGEPMVKEFEQQTEQDLAVLLDPWLPRAGATPEQREAVEDAIRFAATVCLEACRRPGPAAAAGLDRPDAGRPPRPGLVEAPPRDPGATGRAPARGGRVAGGAVRRHAPGDPARGEAGDRRDPAGQPDRGDGAVGAARGGVGRGLAGRVLLLDAARGDLADLIQFGDRRTRAAAGARHGVERPPMAFAGGRRRPERPCPAAPVGRAASIGGTMRFESLYRFSFYAMLFLAALMSTSTTDTPIAMLYPVAVRRRGRLAFLLVDRPRGRGLHRGTANVLALGAFGLACVEFGIEESLLVLACGHLLIYLSLIKMFLPKTVEDDWFLCLLGWSR